MKHPRQHNERHLDFVRGLPCAVCLNNIETEAAHVRMPAPWAGKRQVGKGEKPDDSWAIPLCSRHHREQHEMGEHKFWAQYGTDATPITLALVLWRATGDHELGENIIREWA